jgi:hypothetical protein
MKEGDPLIFFSSIKWSNGQNGLGITGLDPDSITKPKENSGHMKTLLFLNQIPRVHYKIQTNSVAFSPQANYTD